jgi:hypothetical protein
MGRVCLAKSIKGKVMTENKSTAVVPFGKYKGQPIETLRADAGYVDWLMAQDWFRERYQPIYQIVVNNFGEPSETPEHNRLQARFLDKDFCRGVLAALRWFPIVSPEEFIQEYLVKPAEKEVRQCLDEVNSKRERQSNNPNAWLAEQIAGAEARLVVAQAELRAAKQPVVDIVVTCRFEAYGWDALIEASAPNWGSTQVKVEIKPALGDDYPATLRQMHANLRGQRLEGDYAYAVLVFERFTATGATLDQVRAIFKASNITVLAIDDIPTRQPDMGHPDKRTFS